MLLEEKYKIMIRFTRINEELIHILNSNYNPETILDHVGEIELNLEEIKMILGKKGENN